MNVLVAVDAQLFRTSDGKVWAQTIYGYDFWQRYLDVFETVSVASRIKDVDYKEVEGFLQSNGNNVTFKPMPMARGAGEYLRRLPSFILSAMNCVKGENCAIFRLPSIAATFVELVYRIKRKPYLMEVVVDPVNAYANNKIASKILTWHLKNACRRANGVSYVTQFALQQQFPSRARLRNKQTEHYFETYYSSINLKKEFFFKARDFSNLGRSIKIVHTANNINNDVKGHDVVIYIIKSLQVAGVDAYVTFIGDGIRRVELEELANSLGLGNKVKFTGFLSSVQEVRERLLEADIFVFPTKAEGLPRAIIEAMAVGLPCLSTPVDGIPELLEDEFLFDPLDVEGFTNKILELVEDNRKLSDMSKRNIEKAKEYESSVLRNRRQMFYEGLRRLVEYGEKNNR